MAKYLIALLLAGAMFSLILEHWHLRSRLSMLERFAVPEAGRGRADIRPVLDRLGKLEERVVRLQEREAAAEPEAAAQAAAAPERPEQEAAAVARKAALRQDLDILHEEIAALRDWALEQDGLLVLGEGELALDYDLRQLLEPAKERSHPEARAYGPEQVLKAPDAPGGGDSSSAWCPSAMDGGEEWIEVDFEPPVVPLGVLVRETMNPGVVSRIEAFDPGGRSRTLWSGEYAARRGHVNLVIACDRRAPLTARLRVAVDTARVRGWNEIDAVGILAADGVRWGSAARASSVWGSR